jgi:hypothetical protein
MAQSLGTSPADCLSLVAPFPVIQSVAASIGSLHSRQTPPREERTPSAPGHSQAVPAAEDPREEMSSPDGQVSGMGDECAHMHRSVTFGPGIAIPTTSRRAIRQRQGGKPGFEP